MNLLNMENQNVEFKENWQDYYLKWICAFANSHGGILYIGVDDYGNIKGINDYHKLSETIPLKMRTTMGLFCPVEVLEDNNLKYIKITVEKYPYPVSYHGKYYKRIGTTTQEVTGLELDRMMLSTQGKTWDSVPVPYVDINELENDAIKFFKKRALETERMDKESLDVSNATLIQNLHLFETKYLNRAAILAFHPDPEMWFTGAFIKIAFFMNEADILYQDEVHGPLLFQVEKCMEIIYSKYMKALISYDGLYRKEKYFFPKDAFRELLLNAVVHKDYLSTTPIQIRIFEDKLYIWNPGRLPSAITIDNIYEEHISKPCNPNLANVFFKCGLIESWGRGYKKIKSFCELENAKLPEIDLGMGGITVKCFASEAYDALCKSDLNNKSVKEKRMNIILEYLKQHEFISNSEAMNLLEISSRTSRRLLNDAVKEGILIYKGDNKGRIYSLKEKV